MKKQRARRTQAERSDETKGKILHAMLDAIYELGFQNAGTNEVASRAGVSRGALLHHYPTKETLVSAAVALLLDEEIALLRRMADAYRKHEVTLDAFVDYLWSRFSGRLFMITLDYLSAARTDPTVRDVIVPISLKFHRSLNETWVKFFHNDLVSDEEIEALLNATLCLLRGMGIQSVVRKDKVYFDSIIELWKVTLRERLREPEPAK